MNKIPEKITTDGWHLHPQGGFQLILNGYRYARIRRSRACDQDWFAEYYPYIGHYTHTPSLKKAFDFVACRFPDHKPNPEWL